MITVKVAPFHTYENCLWLENGIVEAVVSPKRGARLLRYGFAGRENMLREPEEPELNGHFVRLRRPDGTLLEMPAEYEASSVAGGLKLALLAPGPLGLVHTLEYRLTYGSSELLICHTLKNAGEQEVCLVPFFTTALEEGGLLAIPQSSEDTGDAPNRLFAVWPGTNMSDPRILWGQDFVLVQQANMRAARFGMAAEEGSAAYFNMDSLMIVKYAVQPGAVYPHRGCNIEVMTSAHCTSLILPEPRTVLRPGDELTHEESWTLYADIPCPPVDEWPVGESLRGML